MSCNQNIRCDHLTIPFLFAASLEAEASSAHLRHLLGLAHALARDSACRSGSGSRRLSLYLRYAGRRKGHPHYNKGVAGYTLDVGGWVACASGRLPELAQGSREPSGGFRELSGKPRQQMHTASEAVRHTPNTFGSIRLSPKGPLSGPLTTMDFGTVPPRAGEPNRS